MPQTVTQHKHGGSFIVHKMKVKDLIEMLQKFDGDCYVKNGTTDYPQEVVRGSSGDNEVVIQ